MTNDHVKQERQRAARWKATTATLPDEARLPAPYVDKDGLAEGRPLPFCLPPAFAAHNLLPEVRDEGLALFAELGIPWHAGIDGGPSNHLLSSQVQCVNALGQMVRDPRRVARGFGSVLDVAEVLEIEPGRFLTFEFIGPEDYLGEARDGLRVRGAHCTSVDAAFLFQTSVGSVELALVEWKYTEEYLTVRPPDPARDAVRRQRYAELVAAPDGPVRADVLPFDLLLDEPLYQLVRQQLLAWELEKRHVLDAQVVRVVHVCPPANTAYQASLVRDETRAIGASVDEVWRALQRRSDRFAKLDPAAFLDPRVTSEEYRSRYGEAAA